MFSWKTVPTEPTMESERPIYECTGCGTVTRDPTAQMALYKRAGALSCCPERKMVQLSSTPPAAAGESVTFTYRNWRGEVAERRVRIIGIRFGSTEWHPEPQLLLRAFDIDKGEEREFAVADIGRPMAQGGGDGQ